MILDTSKSLVLDADVIIHFTKGGKISEINTIFPNRCVMTDIVYHELKSQGFANYIDPLIDSGCIDVIKVSSDVTIFAEYATLLSNKVGRGESASMAYCKINRASLASSNVPDIQGYCLMHDIQYVTTMDFVHWAYRTGMWSLSEADFFIYEVKSKGSRLIYNIDTITDYIPRITKMI